MLHKKRKNHKRKNDIWPKNIFFASQRLDMQNKFQYICLYFLHGDVEVTMICLKRPNFVFVVFETECFPFSLDFCLNISKIFLKNCNCCGLQLLPLDYYRKFDHQRAKIEKDGKIAY